MAVSSPWSCAIVHFLAEQGFPVHVVDVNNSMRDPFLSRLADQMIDALRASAASVVSLDLPRNSLGRLFLGAIAVRRAARRTNAQMVLSLYGGSQAATAWLSGIRPYSVYVVGSDILLSDRFRGFVARRALRRAAHVIANGATLRDRTASLLQGARVDLLYLGIDLRRFNLPPAPRAVPAPLRFVCSRAFNAVYDNATIVRAFSTLDLSATDASLTFLSTGPLLPEAEALVQELFTRDVATRVQFARGASDSVFLETLQASSYYLSASHSDGASASLMEAMACGLFPIVSDIPANREWITDGRNGLLFEPGKPESLAQKLELAIAGIPWMARAVAENSATIAQLADSNRNLRHLLALLELERAPGAAKDS